MGDAEKRPDGLPAAPLAEQAASSTHLALRLQLAGRCGATVAELGKPVSTDLELWGYVRDLPSVCQLFSIAAQDRSDDCSLSRTAVLNAFESSRAYRSPHSAEAVASSSLGESNVVLATSSSAVLPQLNEKALEQVRGAIKANVNSAWSAEAVRQGVIHAKSGESQSGPCAFASSHAVRVRVTDRVTVRVSE